MKETHSTLYVIKTLNTFNFIILHLIKY